MKKKPDSKSITVFASGAALILLVMFFLYIREIGNAAAAFFRTISPFFWGFVIAYFMNPLVLLLERFFSRLGIRRQTLLRILSVVTVLLVILASLFGLGYIILPTLIRNILGVLEQLPAYYEAAVSFLSELSKRIDLNLIDFSEFDFNSVIDTLYARLSAVSGELAARGIGFLSDTISAAADLSIALISGIYLLIFKEYFISGIKKLLFALFPTEATERMIDLLRDSNGIFIGYLYSKLITSLIIGGLTLAAMLVLRLPNAPLISAIMTIFNLIPFFGPFLGAVPSVLLLLLEDPYYALLFIIITILVQFIDNQFLTPKIVGDRIGINPFWVLFSIILGGFFGGVPRMFFGVPIFAVLMAILKLFVNNRLRRKGLSTKTEDYHTHKVSK